MKWRGGQGVRSLLALVLTACGPSNPCTASAMHLQARYAQRYVGRWKVAHGDTLTLPQLGDRFKLSDVLLGEGEGIAVGQDRKSTRLNSSHGYISYAVFCLKKKKK